MLSGAFNYLKKCKICGNKNLKKVLFINEQYISATFVKSNKNNKLTKVLIYPEKSQSMNLAFDITPSKYVTGLITEKGVCDASIEGLESLFK